MKRKNYLLIAFSFSLMLVSCSDLIGPDTGNIFFKSFEVEADVIDWDGLNLEMLVSDAPPDAGAKSLLINGGCVMPTMGYDIPKTMTSGHYKISFWAKHGGGSGGTVYLTNNDPATSEENRIGVTPDKDEWFKYESEESFYLEEGKLLRIEIFAGGIVDGGLYLDNIKVEWIH